MKVRIGKENGKYVLTDEFGMTNEECLTFEDALKKIVVKFPRAEINVAVLYLRSRDDDKF